jgi:hypothetical protein
MFLCEDKESRMKPGILSMMQKRDLGKIVCFEATRKESVTLLFGAV